MTLANGPVQTREEFFAAVETPLYELIMSASQIPYLKDVMRKQLGIPDIQIMTTICYIEPACEESLFGTMVIGEVTEDKKKAKVV